MIPAIEMKEAADIQSAAVAMPLARGETPPPATKKSLVDPARDQIAIPMYRMKVATTMLRVQICMESITKYK